MKPALTPQLEQLRSYLAAQPADARAWEALATLLKQAGDRPAAEAACRRAIGLEPEHAFAAWSRLALLLHEDARHAEAENAYRGALAIQPGSGGLWHNFGALLKALNRPAEAAEAYARALQLQGDYPEGYYNLGNLHEKQGNLPAAEAAYRQAIALKPDYAEAYYNLGVVFKAAGQLDAAEAAYRRAIALRAGYAEARNNLGLVLHERDGMADGAAENEYRGAIAAAPHYAEAHNNLGVVLQERHRFAEAAAEFRTALRSRPDYHDAAWNLALMLLISGHFTEAWPLFPARARISKCQTFPPPLPFPEWQGEDLSGRSLLVWPEQGFGDALQFARYLPLLKARGAARVIVACKPPLQRLFSRLPGVDQCLAVEDGVVNVPRCDYWAFIMSLPAVFGTRLDSIPNPPPYLTAAAADGARFAARLAGLPADHLRVGLVWQGSAEHPNDRNRSLPGLETLAPLWGVPGVSFISLQHGPGEAAAQASGLPLLHLGGEISDFAESAALVAELDLIIAVDTAVAHLAGGLGKPVWVLLPFAGLDWRWLLQRADSPWYPEKMRLFRQSTVGDWQPVVAELHQALSQLVAPR